MANIDRAVELATQRAFLQYSDMRHPLPEDYEEEDGRCFCPGCGDSVDHPLYPANYAEGVRLIGEHYTGWHNECAEEQEAEDRRNALNGQLRGSLALLDAKSRIAGVR